MQLFFFLALFVSREVVQVVTGPKRYKIYVLDRKWFTYPQEAHFQCVC